MKKETFTLSTYDIVEIAMLCALAIVLDKFVKIPLGATGGSLNIATLPLFILAIRHGWFKGFIGGSIIFGLISCLLDGYGFACYPLEYFVAFGSTCIIGIFGRKINQYLNSHDKMNTFKAILLIILSVCAFAFIRLTCATIDSMLIYDYEFVPALTYNVTYILPSALLVLVVIILLLPVIISVNKTYPTNYLKENN